MVHARKDYMRYQFPEGKVGGDEPSFIVLARDGEFEAIMGFAIGRYRRAGAAAVAERQERHLELAREWRQDHDVKIADVPGDV